MGRNRRRTRLRASAPLAGQAGSGVARPRQWSAPHGGTKRVSTEPGLDVFRREPDGLWRIVRFLAFSTEPD